MTAVVALIVLVVVLVAVWLLVGLIGRRQRPTPQPAPTAALVADYREFVLSSGGAGSKIVDATTDVFAPGDAGKRLWLPRAMAGNGELHTTITSVIDARSVNVADALGRSCGLLHGDDEDQATGYFGTDNGPVLTALFQQARDVSVPALARPYLFESPAYVGPVWRLHGQGLTQLKAGAGLSAAGMPDDRAYTTLSHGFDADADSFVVDDGGGLFAEGLEFSVWLGVTTGGRFLPSEQVRVTRRKDSDELTIRARNASGTCAVVAHPEGEEVRPSRPTAIIQGNQKPPTPGDYLSGVWHEDDSDGHDTSWSGTAVNVNLRGLVADVEVIGMSLGGRQQRHAVGAVYANHAATRLDYCRFDGLWRGFDFDDYTDQNATLGCVYADRRDYVYDWRNPDACVDLGALYAQHGPGDAHVQLYPKGGQCPGQTVGEYSNCHGGLILSPVGGGYRFSGCAAMAIIGGHFETDQTKDNRPAVLCRSSDLAVRSTWWHDSEYNADAWDGTVLPDQGMVLVDDDNGPSALLLDGCCSLHYIGNNLGGDNLPQGRGWDVLIRRPHRDTRITVTGHRAHTSSRKFGKGLGGYQGGHLVIKVDTETGTDDQRELAAALADVIAASQATIQGGNFDIRLCSGQWLVTSASAQGVEYRPSLLIPALFDCTYQTGVMGTLTDGWRYRYKAAALDDSGLTTGASNTRTSPRVKLDPKHPGAQLAVHVGIDHAPTLLRVWRQAGDFADADPFTPACWADVPCSSADTWLFDEGDRIDGVAYQTDLTEMPPPAAPATTENHTVVFNQGTIGLPDRPSRPRPPRPPDQTLPEPPQRPKPPRPEPKR